MFLRAAISALLNPIPLSLWLQGIELHHWAPMSAILGLIVPKDILSQLPWCFGGGAMCIGLNAPPQDSLCGLLQPLWSGVPGRELTEHLSEPWRWHLYMTLWQTATGIAWGRGPGGWQDCSHLEREQRVKYKLVIRSHDSSMWANRAKLLGLVTICGHLSFLQSKHISGYKSSPSIFS